MTLHLTTDTDRAALLRAIDAQLRPTPAERDALGQTSDAQALLQKLLDLRADVTVVWR